MTRCIERHSGETWCGDGDIVDADSVPFHWTAHDFPNDACTRCLQAIHDHSHAFADALQAAVTNAVFALSAPVSRCAITPYWLGRKPIPDTAAILRVLDRDLLDLFGGSGRIILHSTASRRWWNDADPGLYRLAQAIQSDPAALDARLDRLPTFTTESGADAEPAAQAFWSALRAKPREEWEPEELAWGCAHTFSARLGGRAHPSNQLSAWRRLLPDTHRLLQGVRLTCLDWQDALREALDGEWDVYADPPFNFTGTGTYALGDVDQERLFRLLEPRRAVVSEYHGPRRWHRLEMRNSAVQDTRWGRVRPMAAFLSPGVLESFQ